MDNLSTGEKIAGASGAVLLIVMFAIFDWFSIPDGGIPDGALFGVDIGLSAWDTMEVIRFVILLAALAGIALAAAKVTGNAVDLPVSLSALAAGLGGLAFVLTAFRIIDPPLELDRGIGVFIGAALAAGVAYGGFMAMQEEGTSFGEQADRLQGGGDPPPPSPPPPPAA